MAIKIITVILSFIISACVSEPAINSISGRESVSSGRPDWVRDPYLRYNRNEYVAAVGSGTSRHDAERDALKNLVAYFGQSIQVDERISASYQETAGSMGGVGWSETTNVDSIILLSANMDSLVGAEIGEVWVDQSGAHFAAAILNKPRAVMVYSDMVRANQAMIRNLTEIPDTEKYSFEGYGRYMSAADVADITAAYVNLLRQIGGGPPAVEIRRGAEYRAEAEAIAGTIPIMVRARKEDSVDRAGRIQGAFSKALSDLRFRSGRSNSRYTLDVSVSLTPVPYPGNRNIFTRIEVSANLIDNVTGAVLLPYNFNIREGHISQAEAENRAILSAEQRINTEYANLLGNYLSALLLAR